MAGFALAQSAGTLTLSQARLGNVFLTTETVQIPVVTNADTVAWSVTDFWGTTTTGASVSVNAGGQATIRPASGARGYFTLHLDARRAGVTVAQADTTFAVVAPIDVTTMGDSPFGVMTHFAQGWNTDILPLAARAGLHHVRDEQYWQDVETTRGTYQFGSGYQAYMAALANNGLEPLLELTFGNPLYDHDPVQTATAWAPCSDDGRAGYAKYSAAVLGQYGAQVDTVEVWNEYNGGFCAGPATGNRAAYYTQMLKAAYTAIKAQNPNVRVLGGAAVLAPQPWFEDLFAAGALPYMDAAVIHPYYSVPEDVEKPVQAIQASMAQYNNGAGPKPVWATETSVVDNVNPGRQDMARNLIRSLTVMRVNNVERIYWYLLRDYNGINTGLLRSDTDALGRYVPTAAYPAYANLIQQLYRATFVRREITDQRTRFYLFNKNGAELRVLWSTAPPSRLLLRTTQPLTLIDLMGNARTLQPQSGVINLTVNNDPMYLVGHLDGIQEVGRDLLLADSVNDFNGVQGTAPGAWTYGYYKAASAAYDASGFQPMTWTHTDYNDCWQCPYAYGLLSNTVSSPSYDGNTPVWAVRRWTSNSAGKAHVTGTANHATDGGDGTGIKILVDGREVFSATVGASGGSTAASFDLSVPVGVGSVIDFAATPGPGTDINFDAVDYRAQITLPTPTFPTSYNGWQQQYFTAAQIIDPTISGDNAEPFGDGLCNLLKYAFGIAPNVLAAGWEPFVQVQTTDSLPYLTLSFRRVLATDDLAYLVEAADDLASGAWSANAVLVGAPVDNGDATETDTYRDTVPLTASAKRFMRVRIVRTDGTAN